MKIKLNIGDKIVVQGIMPPASVSNITYEQDTTRTVIELNWGDRGTSKVYLHDENSIWYRYTEIN